MAVVEAEEPFGHLGPSGELLRPHEGTRGAPRRVRSFASPRPSGRTSPIRPRPVPTAMATAATIRGVRPLVTEGAAGPDSGFDRASRRRRIAAAHSPKFHAVIEPTTAANWWLLRVAWRLSRLNAAKSSSRNGLSRQPATVSAGPAVAPLVLAAFFRARFGTALAFLLAPAGRAGFPVHRCDGDRAYESRRGRSRSPRSAATGS